MSATETGRLGERDDAWNALSPLMGGLLIVVLVLIAYWPAMTHGGFVWDDDSYVIDQKLLRDLDGLRRIWIPKETPQYYPVVFSMFWVEYHLWELNPIGYHIVNVLLHMANALLVWRLGTRLAIPGAWLIAALFAVHPVHVESVAWITERKNVLSGFFYLTAMAAYLRFDERRESPPAEPGAKGNAVWRWYAAAFGLFVLALLSKSVTCSLPAALILIMIYQRKRLTWERLIPLIPFFVVGLILALHTAQVEREHVGAEGADFAFSFADRVLIASKALLFYPFKIVTAWPTIFTYPRWHIDDQALMSYWSVAVVALIGAAAVVAFRRGWRGPALALAFYAGTIFPALGFFNIYPMRFSFVADHFQYLASLGVLVIAVGGLWSVIRSQALRGVTGAVVLAGLTLLSFAQAKAYESAEALYRDSLSKNNDAWMPHNNLGNILIERNPVEAEYHYRAALEIKEDHNRCRANLAKALLLQGRNEEALAEVTQASAEFEARRQAASVPGTEALARDYILRGMALERLGRLDEAIESLQRSIQMVSYWLDAHEVISRILINQKRMDEAADQLEMILKIEPDHCEGLRSLGAIRYGQGQFAEAVSYYERAFAAAPDLEERLKSGPSLIRLRATCADPAVRDIARAISLAESLCAETNYLEPALLDILASVYHEAGRRDDAIRMAERAVDLARRQGLGDLIQQFESHLQSYRTNAATPR